MTTKTVIFYFIFGFFTTLLNIVVYYILTNWFSFNYLISNAIAWFMAVVFAFITNRQFVFYNNRNNFWHKFPHFIGSRLISGIIDIGLMFLMVTLISMDDRLSKVLVVIIVFIINFIISKFIIFT